MIRPITSMLMTAITASLTLIQLISEQTVQNLLPILRLKPVGLVHLATPKTVSRSALIAEAARKAQCPVTLETIQLSAMPTMKETMQATLAAIERAGGAGKSALVNFTGGTKLMSIGAYAAALKNKTPSLYVDTQDGVFIDGQTGEGISTLLDGDLSFTPILQTLSVDAIAMANGLNRVTAGRDWTPLLPLAEHLFAHPEDEKQTHAAFYGPDGLCPNGREPRDPKQWLTVLDREIRLPDPCCRLAVQANLLRPGSTQHGARLPDRIRGELQTLANAGNRRVPQFASRRQAAIAPLQQAIAFLSGAWWEVIIAERMKLCGRFRDIRWSVQVGARKGPDLEEDVVALEGVQLVYVSCKRGGAKARLLPLLNEINDRARSLGGAFTRRFLAVRFKPEGPTLANLKKRAGELGIRLLFPVDLEQADPFA